MPESDSDSDLFGSLIERLQEGTADHLNRQMQEAEHIKKQEEAASQRRLEQMWMREHERQSAIAKAKAEQQRQEQKLVRYVLIGAAIVVIIIIIMVMGFSLLDGAAAPDISTLLSTAYA